MKLTYDHPRVLLLVAFLFTAIPVTAMLIFGLAAAWTLMAVPWVGAIIFGSVAAWYESETRARWRRTRAAHRRSRASGAAG